MPHSLFVGVAKPGGLRGWYFSDLQLMNLIPELSWNWPSMLMANSTISRVDRVMDMHWSEEIMGSMRYNKQESHINHTCVVVDVVVRIIIAHPQK